MNAHRSTARIVGILFIVATATAIIGGLLMAPATEPGHLAEAAQAEGRIVGGALLVFVLAVAVFAIAALLFPLLKREDEGLALGYLGARTVEGMLILAGIIPAAMTLALSKAYGPAGGEAVEALGDTLVTAFDWAYLLGPTAMFSVSALVLNVLLYRSRLVPTWLSVWGFAGGALLLISAVFEMFGVALGGWQAVFSAPIGVQEMVFAVWLIVKGLAVAPDPTTRETKVPAHTGA